MGNCLRLLQQQHNSRPKSIDGYDDPVFTHHYTDSVDTELSAKKVRFSVEEGGGDGRSMRVKLVISKQKLKQMIANGGVVSVSNFQELIQNQENVLKIDSYDEDCDSVSGKGWKPALKSIPESDYCS